VDAGSNVEEAELEQVPLARVFGARQRDALPTPMVQETELPLRAVVAVPSRAISMLFGLGGCSYGNRRRSLATLYAPRGRQAGHGHGRRS